MNGTHVLGTILLVANGMLLLLPRLEAAVESVALGRPLLILIGLLSLVVAFFMMKDGGKKVSMPTSKNTPKSAA